MQIFLTPTAATAAGPSSAPICKKIGWGSLAGWLVLGAAGLVSVGCAQVWGSSTKGASDNCVRNPDACNENQICNTFTEACEDTSPADMSMPDLYVGPQPPTSFIFPGGLTTGLTGPRDAQYSLEAQGPAKIYYTMDGSYPKPGASGTMSGASPVQLGYVAGGTTLHWSADYGSGYSLEDPHTFTASTTSTPPDDFGYISDAAVFDLNGQSIVTVSPGTSLTGAVNAQVWQSTPVGYCPGCVIQYVISVQSVGAVGCSNVFTGSYPGGSGRVPFALNAPLDPGIYRMYAGFTLQFSCDGTVANGPDVGEIIVQ